MKAWRRTKRLTTTTQPSIPGLLEPLARFRRLATRHEQALDVARSRLVAAICLFAVAYVVIALRLADLTLLGETPEQQGSTASAPSDGVSGRADITDRNGIVLASSVPTHSLCVDSKRLFKPDEAAKLILTVLPDLDPQKLHDDLHSGKHCALIRRHLSPRQYYEMNKLGIAGLEFQPDEVRLYPAGNVTAHVVGYTDIDNQGIAGIEKSFDNPLEEQQQAVALSLDLRVQNIMQRELADAMTKFKAIGAAGMVMDIRTGEILAMVSLPDFDPVKPGAAGDDARFNRDTLGVYEMGSTFKVFNTAMALDSGQIHTGDMFDAVHPISIGSQTIRDFEPAKRWLNVAEIFIHSSNIGSAHMAEKMGSARQRAFLSKLGLMERQSLEIPEMGAPLMPSIREWGETATMTVAYGHGIAVNAVQLVSAVGTVVNDGVPVRPTLLRRQPTPELSEEDKKALRVISSRTSAQMRALMRLVVTRGTAKSADVPGYLLGGKTGTANKISGKGYTTTARLSSFVGVFPINAPRYAVFAMLDDPKGNAKTYGFATGGWIAAPVVSRVVGQIGPMLHVTPYDAEMQEAAEKQVLKPLNGQIVDGMPVDEGSNYASNESHSVP